MRIIAGTFGNRRLFSINGAWLRPTSDRNRETLFSLLGKSVEGRRVLDLFAGTGALGIEALSRGAEEATFVDRSPLAADLIRKNLDQLQIKATVFKSDVLTFLRRAGRMGTQYDLIFCDPPYEAAETQKIVNQIEQHNLLADGGLFVLETSARNPVPAAASLALIRQKKMGDTCITIYGRSHATE
jgi:16S rRNA (guanine966-N2)-methyltransferase